MKNRLYFVVSLSLAMFAFESCSSDDNGSEAVGSVIGRWNYSTEKNYADGVLVYDGPYSDNSEGCLPDYIELSEDGTWLHGDFFTSNFNCVLDNFVSTYVRTGNNIVLNEGAESVYIEIIGATNSQMIFKTSYTSGGNTDITELTFVKSNE